MRLHVTVTCVHIVLCVGAVCWGGGGGGGISKYVVTRSMFKNVLCSVNMQRVHVLSERG